MTHVFSKREQRRWFKTLDRRISSAAVQIEDTEGKLLVVKANYKKYWSLPGGLIDADESPSEAALREVREETGLSLDPRSLAFHSVAYRHSTRFNSYRFIFQCNAIFESDTKLLLQESEIDAAKWVSKQQVLEDESTYGEGVVRWANEQHEPYTEQIFNF